MSEERALYTHTPTQPEISIWQTATDLAGTNMQRKQYFCTLSDGETKFDFILVVGPGLALATEPHVAGLAVEPYRAADYDYTQFDGDEDELEERGYDGEDDLELDDDGDEDEDLDVPGEI